MEHVMAQAVNGAPTVGGDAPGLRGGDARASLVDEDRDALERRLLGAVAGYKAACAAAGERPSSREAWMVFLAALADGQPPGGSRVTRRSAARGPASLAA